MALIATEGSGKEIPPAPEGTHVARCIMLVDLGTQENKMFGKWARKCRIAFELPEEKYTFDEARGPEPYVVGNNYTLSTGDKSSLRKFLKAWRGRDFTPEELKAFDMKAIVGKPCLLTLGHKSRETDGRVFAEIVSISPLMKGQQAPPQVLPTTVFEVEEGRDSENFKKLPEWIRKEIEKCQEWQPAKIEDRDVPSAPMPHAIREQQREPVNVGGGDDPTGEPF